MSQVGFVAVAAAAATAIVVIEWEGVIIFEDIVVVDIFSIVILFYFMEI